MFIYKKKVCDDEVLLWNLKVNLATVVESDQIATTPKCVRVWGATTFLGLLHFTLDTHLILPSIKQEGIKYHFKSLWYDATWDWTQVSRIIGEHSTY